MNYKSIPIFILFMLISLKASYADFIILEGKIGDKTDIVMALNRVDDKIVGKYYYKKYGVDIFLTGKQEAFNEIQNYDEDNDNFTINKKITWKGNFHGDTYEGQLVDENNKVIAPFSLKKIYFNNKKYDISIDDFIGGFYDLNEESKDIYNKTKYNYEITKTNKTFKFMGGDFVYYLDKRTNIYFPYLNKPNNEKTKSINAIIKKHHMQQSVEALYCFSWGQPYIPNVPMKDYGYSGDNTQLIFYDKNYLSMLTTTVVGCGPPTRLNIITVPVSIDIKNNKDEDFNTQKYNLSICTKDNCSFRKDILEKASFYDANISKSDNIKDKNSALECLNDLGLDNNGLSLIRLNENEIGITYSFLTVSEAAYCYSIVFSIPLSELNQP